MAGRLVPKTHFEQVVLVQMAELRSDWHIVVDMAYSRMALQEVA